jgi:hypothetical protein
MEERKNKGRWGDGGKRNYREREGWRPRRVKDAGGMEIGRNIRRGRDGGREKYRK